MRLKFLLFLSIGLLTFFIFGFTFPQNIWASSSDVSVDILPANPSPGENTTINLSSYAVDLNSVMITWLVDGKKILSGIGKKSFSINAPEAGGETTITVHLMLTDGDVDKKIVLRPNVMVLLWQADDSYTPPFYRGKALPTANSAIKIVAMPEINGTDPKNMVYAWKKDYTNNVDGSGYGKNYFSYTSDYLDDTNTVSVVASTTDQRYSSEKSLDVLNTTQPKIIFYKRDAKLGTMWENALTDNHKIIGEEVIEASPYFVSPKNIDNPGLSLSWFLNDEQVPTNVFLKNILPVKVQIGVTGGSLIKLKIDNNYKITETVEGSINVQF